MDQLDIAILNCLQEEGRESIAAIAEKIGLSEAPTWRRVRRLEEEGLITGYHAALSRRALGLGVFAFVSVRFSLHDIRLAADFARDIQPIEAVLACHNVTGDTDYILIVVTTDLDEYQKFTLQLRAMPGVSAIKSYLSLEEVKAMARLPLG